MQKGGRRYKDARVDERKVKAHVETFYSRERSFYTVIERTRKRGREVFCARRERNGDWVAYFIEGMTMFIDKCAGLNNKRERVGELYIFSGLYK